MLKAIRLARNGKPAPNPKVGSLIIKEGRIVGTGFHRRAGYPHAETIALIEAGTKARGGTLITTLEPCCHYGQTPPCTDQIIKFGIRKVMVGMIDPNPIVSGMGIRRLEEAGCEVEVGIEASRCEELNRGYIKRIKTGLPYTMVKIASSLDGRIATVTGESKWITSLTSRRWAHLLRSRVDAVVIGIGTVLSDDPELTVRLVPGENPARIIIDPELKIRERDRVLSEEGRTIILSKKDGKRPKAEVVLLERFDPESILKKIGSLGFNEIMIEGGGKIFSSIIRSRLFDEIIIIYGPVLLGDGIPFTRFPIERLSDGLRLKVKDVKRSGPDLIVELERCLPGS